MDRYGDQVQSSENTSPYLIQEDFFRSGQDLLLHRLPKSLVGNPVRGSLSLTDSTEGESGTLVSESVSLCC